MTTAGDMPDTWKETALRMTDDMSLDGAIHHLRAHFPDVSDIPAWLVHARTDRHHRQLAEAKRLARDLLNAVQHAPSPSWEPIRAQLRAGERFYPPIGRAHGISIIYRDGVYVVEAAIPTVRDYHGAPPDVWFTASDGTEGWRI